MNKIQLSIPTPCHENWDNMSSEEKGKFCGACQKTVMDFTRMSDRQLAEFFKKPAGNVCGRFYDDQLNREIDLSVPRKRIPWIKYFFQFSLPAFLFSFKATAQGKVKVKQESQHIMTLGFIATRLVDMQTSDTKLVSGMIVDERGEPIPQATIIVKDTQMGTMTDSAGKFSLKIPGIRKPVLIVQAIGFESKEVQAANGNAMKIVLNAMWMGEVVITRRKPAKKNKRTANKEMPVETEHPVVPPPPLPIKESDYDLAKALSGRVVCLVVTETKAPDTLASKPTPLIKKIMDTAFQKFAVYPNPVPRNSMVRIDMQNLEPGAYTVSIIDMGGVVVQTEDLRMEERSQLINLRLNKLSAGTYLVHLFNRRTAASYTEKIIIQ
jgi:hypothetical protein